MSSEPAPLPPPVDLSGPPAVDAPPVAGPPAGGARWLVILESQLHSLSDYLNPILIKEARQALKSRQFLITFCLVLTFGWLWTLLGIAAAENIFFAPAGRYMLVGYYIVLAVPLLLVVPFAAFRSLAAEREDGTFELVAITSLSARQIITGKLGSALLQMLVYYSALSPCVVFTYLLRGIDIITILLLLTYTFMASLLVTVIGLGLATVSRSRTWQVFLSVLLLAGLLGVGVGFSFGMIGLLSTNLPVDQEEFWISMLVMLSFYVSYVVLIISAAAAQISFPSDNRATRLRIIMLVQQFLLIFWTLYLYQVINEVGTLIVIMLFGGIHWWIMGALMIGETAQLSPRVRRSLPQSLLGRMAFTWFNPGSGTGYMFAVGNLFVCALVALAGATYGFTQGQLRFEEVAWFSMLMLGYVALFLGVGRIIHEIQSRYFHGGMALSLLVQVVMLIIGVVVSLSVQVMIYGVGPPDYSVIHAPNVFWTLAEALENDISLTPGSPVLILTAAIVIWLINMVLSAKEVSVVREEIPWRVQQDEAERRGPAMQITTEHPLGPIAADGADGGSSVAIDSNANQHEPKE